MRSPNMVLPLSGNYPKWVIKTISDLSCDGSTFNNEKVIYELALKHSGYKSETKFYRQTSTRRNRNHLV